jgi:rhodanese-related sulfurtransferase
MFSGAPRIPSIGVEALPDDAYLIDVREDDEWAAGHAPDARHISLGEVPARLAEVPQGREVYVVCKAGGRSAQATKFLIDAGREAVNVAGGMLAWEAARRPMVADAGQPPYVL